MEKFAMGLISELSTVKKPVYAETLRQFKLGAVADKVGVSYGYLINVLTGTRKPGAKLDKKLAELAKQIELEQA